MVKYRTALTGNIVYLYLLQGANYLFPLITFPYMVRVLGIDKFGLLSYTNAVMLYFLVLTDYGFNLSATREISIHRNNIQQISKTFSVVMIVKSILMLFSFFVLSVTVFAFPKFRSEWLLYYISFIAIVGNVLFPVWLLQGLEKMKVITIINLITRALSTVAIFVFIRSSNDYLLAAFIQASSVIIAGLICICIVFAKYNIRFMVPNYIDIKKAFIDGWYIFVSQISTTLLGNTAFFVLGLFATAQVVGYLAVADKINKIAVSVTTPICTAIYPRVSDLMNSTRAEGVKFIRKVMLTGIPVFSIMCLILFWKADLVVSLVTGANNQMITLYVRIMSALPLLTFLNNLFGIQTLLNLGKYRQFMNGQLYPGLISVILSFIFVPFFHALATSVINVFAEMLVFTIMSTYVHREGVYLLFNRVL